MRIGILGGGSVGQTLGEGFSRAGHEVAVNATSGRGSVEAVRACGAALDGEVLIDVSNPLDVSRGMPPFLLAEHSGPTSLAEAIQAEAPGAQVVKCFNTVTAAVMVDPSLVAGEHDLFLCGNDGEAKAVVRGLAEGFGWRRFVDLGDLAGARAQEAFVVIWVRLWMTQGTPLLGYRIAGLP
jgi:predicted dinucleotide-binding enzyme